MNHSEIDKLADRLASDVRYLTETDEKLRTSIRLGARWQGAADMAYILGRTDIEQACHRAILWIDATSAYLRGSKWSV